MSQDTTKKPYMHEARQAASDAYDAARLAWLKASDGGNPIAFEAADKALDRARAKLNEMEALHPTPAENSQRSRFKRKSDKELFS